MFSKFSREQLLIAAGISFPLFIIAVFALLSVIPGLVVDDPEYDFYFTANSYSNQEAYVDFRIVKGKIHGAYISIESPHYRTNKRLYRFDAETQSVSEIDIIIPDDTEPSKKGTLFMINEVSDVKLDQRSKAPDGYEILPYRYRHHGLMTELIIGHSSRGRHVLKKNSREINIPQVPRYGNFRFLGWVTAVEQA